MQPVRLLLCAFASHLAMVAAAAAGERRRWVVHISHAMPQVRKPATFLDFFLQNRRGLEVQVSYGASEADDSEENARGKRVRMRENGGFV